MTLVTRRTFLVSTAATLAGVGLPRRSHGQTSVKVGTAVLGDYCLSGPMLVAQERGFFKDQGLDVEYIPFRGGPHLVKAVIAGEVLLGASGSTDVLVFRDAGMPIKMIATHTERNHFTFNVAPDVKALQDLKGQSIGVTAAGATTWVFARLIARQQGWNPDRDVKIVALGGLDAQLAALARNEVKAFVWGDGGAALQVQGKTRVLMRLDQVTPKWISQIQYTSEDAIKKNSDALRKAMRAIFKAQRMMKQDPKPFADLMSKKLGWSAEAVLAAHKVSGPLMSDDGRIDTGALKVMQDTLIEQGVLKKRLPLDEHYTTDFTPVRA